MENTMKVIIKATGKIETAIYASKPNGDKRMWVDGKFYSDKQFDKLFVSHKSVKLNEDLEMINEDDLPSTPIWLQNDKTV